MGTMVKRMLEFLDHAHKVKVKRMFEFLDHTYKVREKVMKSTPEILPKLRRKREGPYTVTAVHDNGTLSIRRGAITERINLRRVDPFTE